VEARAILVSAAESIESSDVDNDFVTVENFTALQVLEHALDYLKGKEVRGLFSYTRAIMEFDEDLKNILTASEPLVQIAAAVVEEDYPGWNPNSVARAALTADKENL
jgi:hypothetical protein